MILKQAYPMTRETWKAVGVDEEIPSDYDPKYHGLKHRNVAIGEIGSGEERSYIIEPFFPQILEMVFNHEVKVHIDLYADPAVVVEKDGKIVLHNADVESIKIHLDKVISKIPEPNRIHAMTEIRQSQYNQCSIGNITRVVRQKLTDLLPKGILFPGMKLNYDFMRLYFMEKYNLDFSPEKNSLQEKLRRMSKTDLLSVYGSMVETRKTGATWYEPGATLIREGATIDEIEEAYLRELEFRFFSGQIS